MSVDAAILRFARSVVESVGSQVSSQVDRVHDEVENKAKAFIQEVMEGIWIGQGAEAFVDVILNECMPELQQLMDDIIGLNISLRDATNTIDNADHDCRAMVDSLVDTFEAI